MDFVSNRKKILAIKIFALCFFLVITVVTGFISWGHKSGAFGVARIYLFKRLTFALNNFGFTLKHVKISGNIKTTTGQIHRTLNFKKNMSIFDIDLEKSRKNLEQMPWVRKAIIKRILPDTITIELYERHPIAIWQTPDKKYMPIDEDGKIVHTGIKGLKNFIVITGDDAPNLSPELIDVLNNNKDIKERIKAAVRVGSRRWDIILDDIKDGVTVSFPETDMKSAYEKLITINKKHKIINDETKLIDLRIKDRIRIRFKENSNEVLWNA